MKSHYEILQALLEGVVVAIVRLDSGLELSAETEAGRGRDLPPVGSGVYLSVSPDNVIVTPSPSTVTP